MQIQVMHFSSRILTSKESIIQF